MSNFKIVYTETDEAPALATYSFLPVVRAFAAPADIELEASDISLSGRIIAQFPDLLSEEQRVPDELSRLGELAKQPEANIIKLPNISASIPQLKAAIKELQEQGYALPDYPEAPKTDAEKDAKARYDKVKGSAVNPVLREGNSDRRAPAAVKGYVRKHPHRMGSWSNESRSHVAHMEDGDFFGSEKSVLVDKAGAVRIEWQGEDGAREVLKEKTELLAGEVIDSAVMSRRKLRDFLSAQIRDAKERDVLFSLHLKATMMKVSDPIIFGHAVAAYFQPALEKHAEALGKIGVDLNDGVGELFARLQKLPESERNPIEADLKACFNEQASIAMVDSDKGISNLHVPSDVIIDASMPAMIRDSGKMWNADGERQDAKAVIPDRCYAELYQVVIEDCKQNGAFDPTTMGTVPNVGLMAQKAEEYGSHDKTFEVPGDGVVQVIDASGEVLTEHRVETGDIWRMCQTKDAPVRDWVKLAVNRARETGVPAVFWLNPERAHDAQLIKKVETYLKDHDIDGLDIRIMDPVAATRFSLERIRRGEDTISVTGNVLRDYLTDLFPIMELGTSAKMLSIVPLMNGGGLFETGAGGSAPKHVQQLVEQNHLRWDSLGEFLALAASFEHYAKVSGNAKARVLASALDRATGRLLEEDKSPSRKTGELDNRGSHFYLALYWAQELAAQSEDTGLQADFKPLAEELAAEEQTIVNELKAVQGKAVDIGGYYRPVAEKVSRVMRASETFNRALERVKD